MKGQPEQGHDLGIGKKVVTPTKEVDPWVKVKPGVYRNTQTGTMETRVPGNEAANQQPVVDPIIDFYRRQGLIWND